MTSVQLPSNSRAGKMALRSRKRRQMWHLEVFTTWAVNRTSGVRILAGEPTPVFSSISRLGRVSFKTVGELRLNPTKTGERASKKQCQSVSREPGFSDRPEGPQWRPLDLRRMSMTIPPSSMMRPGLHEGSLHFAYARKSCERQ